ncbi:hypothetical protein E2C01_014954 [Portunus trituberculatus]|uniref:Uncharacterized protein n=1 Tax=Portunus trituberculatus TaxID=210409 RepID=A0A5B7DKE4_PORTR|nr:hypothetical protein [Portunus trituberculatus]
MVEEEEHKGGTSSSVCLGPYKAVTKQRDRIVKAKVSPRPSPPPPCVAGEIQRCVDNRRRGKRRRRRRRRRSGSGVIDAALSLASLGRLVSSVASPRVTLSGHSTAYSRAQRPVHRDHPTKAPPAASAGAASGVAPSSSLLPDAAAAAAAAAAA